MGRMLFHAGNERGMILPLTLIVLVVLSTLVAAMLALGTTEPQIAKNLVAGAQALSLAEAGADRAVAYFMNDSACVASANNPDDYPTLPVGCGSGTGATLWTSDTLGASNLGSYTVSWAPTSWATVMITSTGTTTGGISRVVRVVVSRQWSVPYGVLSKDTTVTGNAEVRGNAGAVHGNNSTTLSGSDWVVQTATSSGGPGSCTGCTNTSHVGDTGDSGYGKPQAAIPNKTAADYMGRANIILGGGSTAPSIPAGKCSGSISVSSATGGVQVGLYTGSTVPGHWVLDARTTSCVLYPDNTTPNPATTLNPSYTPSAGLAPANPFSSWSMVGAGGNAYHWSTQSSGNPPDAAYYATTEIDVGGVGSTSTPWNATFIVGGVGSPPADSGVVQFTSNPVINPYTQTTSSTAPWYNNGLLTIAGNVNFTGTGVFSGTVIATGSVASQPAGYHGNIDVGGNITLTGNLVAYNQAYVTGSAGGGGVGKIIYNVANRSKVLNTNLQLVSWHAISTLD